MIILGTVHRVKTPVLRVTISSYSILVCNRQAAITLCRSLGLSPSISLGSAPSVVIENPRQVNSTVHAFVRGNPTVELQRALDALLPHFRLLVPKFYWYRNSHTCLIRRRVPTYHGTNNRIVIHPSKLSAFHAPLAEVPRVYLVFRC